MNVHINSRSGELLTEGQVFGPQLSESDFLHSSIGRTAKKVSSKGTRVYYDIWLSAGDGRELAATLGFLPGNGLERINLKVLPVEAKKLAGSEETEKEIKHFHDEWLLMELGRGSYEFSWGTVLSIVEPHWNSAIVVIDYSRRHGDKSL
jgi:hypothetical protein